jgi:NAD+ synthase (glutamine-hydrolysing)
MAERPFFTPYAHEFVRVGACTPAVAVADPAANARSVLELVRAGAADGARVLAFPELCLTAYAVDDLHLQEVLLEAAEAALAGLIEASLDLAPLFVVGLPVRAQGRLYNAAAAVHRGRLLAVTPKTFLPNYREFYERRWFASGAGVKGGAIVLAGREAPFGTDILLRATGACPFLAHLEICEDLWVPEPPSSAAAMAGAELLLNLSASNITIAKAETRRLLCLSQSARCLAAYVYAAAGPGESTTDLAFDGQTGIFELGETLIEGERFRPGPHMTLADVDLGRLRAERLRQGSFSDGARALAFREAAFDLEPPPGRLALKRPLERFPYVPADPARLERDCEEAWNIQVQGLAQRLKATGLQDLVIGVSGGLDSTEALVVAAKAMDQLGLSRRAIHAYSLPGFATSEGTRASAKALMTGLGVTGEEIDIRPMAMAMLGAMDHPYARGEQVFDVAFENVQAGLRTDILFRLANQKRALVVGTGDLSELGLGWCTYGVGDQMSHYNPNGSVSKTLIQHLIRFAARSGDFSQEVSATLERVLETEISPELVPDDGRGLQSTEAVVGPYALQDFNLYYLTRYGFRPSKIAFLAFSAWGDAARGRWPAHIAQKDRRAYDLQEIRHWLELFLVRFFANQFKRSALPNGPKTSSGGSLSPRGDWRMPSDASPTAWLEELRRAVPETAEP